MKSKTANWYEVSVRYRKLMDDGSEKAVTEVFVVEAVSFSDAEARAIECVTELAGKAIEIKKINPATYREIYFLDDDTEAKWWKAKLAFITIDDATNKERRSNVTYLVQAEDLEDALDNINQVMKGSVIDHVTANISETKIVEVFTLD